MAVTSKQSDDNTIRRCGEVARPGRYDRLDPHRQRQATGSFAQSTAANPSSLSTPAISADEPTDENPRRLCVHRPVAQFLPITP
jgi:hypothetical protein